MNIKDNKLINFIKKNPWIEYVFFFILFIVINIVFANKTNILTSGYHFADDHEIIDINHFINTNGLFSAIVYYIKDDLVWRFRPFYFFLRVIYTFIFKTNFYYWHLFRAIGVGLVMFVSYVLARKLKTPVLTSFIFSFIYFIGTQDEVIWRLGPQENLGLFFLALSLIFIIDYHNTNKKAYGILSTITIVLLTMCKESFALMAPAVILFLFYLEVKDNKEDENKNIFIQLGHFILRHKVMIIVIVIELCLCAAVVLGYTGLYNSGYAGIDTSYTFGEYIRLTLNVFVRDLKDYWIAIIISIVLIICSIIINKKNKTITKQYLRSLFIALVFYGYSMVGQAVIHGTSSMFTRYYLPCVWVLYFVISVMENTTINKWIHLVLIVGLLVIANVNLEKKECSISMDGEYFAEEGNKTTDILKYVGTLKDKYQDMVVITKFSWYEQNYSASIYLQDEEGISEVYYLDEEREDGDYKKIFNESEKRIFLADADVIMTSDKDDFDLDKYNVTEFDSFCVLEKK